MKIYFIIGLIPMLMALGGITRTQNDEIPLAPEKYRRPENYHPAGYKYSLEELKNNFSEEMMQRASSRYERIQDVNNKGKWKPTPGSLDSHQIPEWFKDAKFGMFVDWGLWAIAGWAPKKEEGAMYPDWYEWRMYTDPAFVAYHEKNWGNDFERDDFIPLFRAEDYNPEKLVDLAVESGMKYIVPFCKHHTGFCLWPSSFTYRDAADMGPGKDLIGPLLESCKKQGLKFGFYFSIMEWEYPLIDDHGNLVKRIWGGRGTESYSPQLEKMASGKIAVKNFTEDYLVPQATEFIDKYDPDILWYDGDGNNTAVYYNTYDISAYFYNQAEGRKEVAVNDRYGLEDGRRLRHRRGDIYTSEYHGSDDGKEVKEHYWEENRGISQSFGFNWQDTEDNVISSENLINMFVDIVSRGGNLLLIVNLDGQGALPRVQENRLKDIGKWLKVNGEAIYGSRPWRVSGEGDALMFTQSKDGRVVYAICNDLEKDVIEINSVYPNRPAEISILGMKEEISWQQDRNTGKLVIQVPEETRENLSSDYAYTIKIKL